MYENARTVNWALEEITSFEDLKKAVPAYANGYSGTVAVFHYRCGTCQGDVILPESEAMHRAFCEEIGAQIDNHQLIVRHNGNSSTREKWVFYWFHDNNVYVTNDPDKVRIFERGQRG